MRKRGKNSDDKGYSSRGPGGDFPATILNPARIYGSPQESKCLDLTELTKLEHSFREWASTSVRADVRISRKRILLIFLLIRYTGARLNEVLALKLEEIDQSKLIVRFGGAEEGQSREVRVTQELMDEMNSILREPDFPVEPLLKIDPAHVRRKFYERAVDCGFAQDLGAPNAIRRARANELMQKNVPLPVVQRILGQSTPNLTASLVTFSEDDITELTKRFVERESRRKTSARNAFFGKVGRITGGDIQSQVDLVTPGGDTVTTVITNDSLHRLGLKEGSLISAEVKAPWVILQKADSRPSATAENVFKGIVTRILSGRLITEFTVRIKDGTEMCSVVTERSRRNLDFHEGDEVWVLFNSFAVILRVD